MPPPPAVPPARAPSFGVIERQPPRPVAILLAILAAAGILSGAVFGLGHSKARRFAGGGSSASRSAGGAGGASAADDDKDDPSQVDTIILGDAADAPVPAPARRSGHASAVHATILIRLPRFGDQVGLIPDTSSGRLLFRWLAAFNQASPPALQQILPNSALVSTVNAQMALRQQTGGFNLLSAREVQPGVLVFRLRDQSPAALEVLGTLHMRQNSTPPAIGSFSLRAVPPPGKNAP